MRRRITLYIADQKVDLSDENLVLMNYALTDLTNPAVMRNSYSQTVTLPGTGTNDAVFSHYFRPDHTVAGGYDPLIRVPFTIYDDLGEIIASGYCKLLRVTLEGLNHTYEVQLYGSLGEFIFGLAYDADGNKKTLASLDYLGGGDTELDFTITAQAVADAWARLGGDTSKPAMWDVINFAPAYNGIPDGDFDPSKALADPNLIGISLGGNNPSPGGYVLLDFPQAVDEWAAKDLRSYLQRPVLSVKAFLEAIAMSGNNGGWSVDISDIDSTAEWPYLNTWITRPLLPSLGSFKQEEGSITATPSASATSGPDLIDIALSNVPAGTDVSVRASFGIQVNLASSAGQTTMYTGKKILVFEEYRDVWFMQAVGYASDNSVVAASPVTIFGPDLSNVSDLAQFATDCTFVPTVPIGQTAQYVAFSGFDSKSFTGSGTAFVSRGSFGLEVTGKNMASVKVIVKRGRILWRPIIGHVESVQNLTTFYKSESPEADAINEISSLAISIDVTATASSSSPIRSGARITKQMLLSTEGTPADYLTSICKAFGLYILADSASKTAKILRRTSLYQNETIDLTERVDTSQPVELKPIAFDAKWYAWRHASVGGAFEKEYKKTIGRDYGAQRVDTGYDFDASEKDVLDGSVLKSAAAVRDSGQFWNVIEEGGKFKPSPFLLPGNKFTSWDASGQSVDTDIPSVGSGATITEYAGGYDISERAEFRDKDGKPVDGSDVLLLAENFLGIPIFNTFTNFHLTDDVTDMDTIVGKPCWLAKVTRSYNLFDKDGVVMGEYINTYGDIMTAAGWARSPYIPVTAGETYLITCDTPQNYAYGVSFFDSNFVKVSGGLSSIYNTPKVVPAGASYMVFTVGSSNTYATDVQVVKGSTPLPYIPYGQLMGMGVPKFSRYVIQTTFPDPLLPGVNTVIKSLDFGVPRELYIPDVTYPEGSTIFAKAWKDYILDRLDKDVKVMRCRVRLDGLMVGPELLRKFFWYRGSIWVLNKISNYSLTTFDLAECEFIQVRDMNAYLNGQY